MKKSLIALAALAAAGVASAQSSVTLFGIVDAAVTIGRGEVADRTRLTNSGYNSSRLGFRGTEDLGGGMSASFWLEGALANDDGNAAGFNFQRRSTVSLAGGWGELRLGRDYVPDFWNLTVFDPFGTNGVGTTQVLNGVSVNPTTGAVEATNRIRASNTVGYFLPSNLGGFYGQAMYVFGENLETGAPTDDDGNSIGLRVGYAAGPFNVAVAYSNIEFATGDEQVMNIGGQWDFGFAKLMGHYQRNEVDGAAAEEGDGFLIGGLVPVGAGEIRVSYSQYEVDTPAGDPRSRKLALGYVHNLSKRTALYTTVARVRNNGGANSSLGGSLTGVNQNSTGFDIGVRHSF